MKFAPFCTLLLISLLALFSAQVTFAVVSNQVSTTSRMMAVKNGPLYITEISTSGIDDYLDEDRESSDWIEIYNAGLESVNLEGWHLTDDASNLRKWSFPRTTLPPGDFLVVFASGKNRVSPRLHTNFRLSVEGEYLGLVMPDGLSVSHAFTPHYPNQNVPKKNISYGLHAQIANLAGIGANARVHVPNDGSLQDTWKNTGFDDSSWTTRKLGIGYGSQAGMFHVTLIESNLTLSSLEEVDMTLQNPLRRRRTFTGTSPVINYNENNSQGNFASDSLFPGHGAGQTFDDFILLATAAIIIPENGVYTFGINSDDGARLRIDGMDVIVDDNTHAAQDIFGIVQLSEGVHELEFVYFERGGGAGCELFAAKGTYGSFNSSVFRLVGDSANGGIELEGFGTLIQSDVASVMKDNNASVYVRLPFTLPEVSDHLSLLFRMTYNDGFVAHLNGQEIARRNAPASVSWNSNATAKRTSAETVTTETIPLPLPAGLLRAGENVLAIQGLNFNASDNDFLLLPELLAADLDPQQERFFTSPTPGKTNGKGVLGFIDPPLFSADHGFFDSPFTVSLTPRTAGSIIRYTTDGSVPTADHGIAYTDPITIDQTTLLRAVAFIEGYEPSAPETRTYIFIHNVLTQKRPPDYPTTWANGVSGDYEMDPDVINDPRYRDQMEQSLKSLPTLSIVMEYEDLFGRSRGIYTHPESKGLLWERPASIEYILPSGQGFQINAGIRIQGGYSRVPDHRKHSFRILFKGDYGPTKLRYPLFQDSPVNSFDQIVLRGAYNYTWHAMEGGFGSTIGKAEYMRDQFSRQTQLDLGQVGVHGNYAHVYLNGMYWGLYNVTERADGSFTSSYYGGDKEEWDIVTGGSRGINSTQVKDGSKDAWNAMMALANQNLALDANYQALQQYIDIDSLIGYMLTIIFTGNRDAPTVIGGNGIPWNFYSGRWRKPGAGYKFFAWDSEWTLEENDVNVVNFHNGQDNPGRIFQRLRSNEEFRMRFADAVQKFFFNGGPLTPEASRARYQAIAESIELAIISESARWGDAKSSRPKTKDDDWVKEVNRILNDYLQARSGIVLQQLRTADLFPRIPAPEFNPQGGYIEPGLALAMKSESNTTLQMPLVYLEDDWYYNQTSSSLPSNWISAAFNDSDWPSGRSLFYVETAALPAAKNTPLTLGRTTYYFRKRITIPAEVDLSTSTFRLNTLLDDGAVIYINGREVLRIRMPDGTINYNTFASSTVDNAVLEGPFQIPSSYLRNGGNIIAVEVHQTNATSSDVVFGLSLTATVQDTSMAGNPIYYTLDGSDPRMPGGAINPAALPYQNAVTLNDSTFVRARAFDGETWSAMNEAAFSAGTASSIAALLQEHLRITEIMYNPPLSNDYEYIELHNTHPSLTLDLGGAAFIDGITFLFPEGTLLPPKGYLILSGAATNTDLQNLRDFYKIGANTPIIGPYLGRLANEGERITLANALGETVISFAYGSGRGWPVSADGAGHSLVPKAAILAMGEVKLLEYGGNWRQSAFIGGSPGEADPEILLSLTINEFMTNTSSDAEETDSNDWVEIYNPNAVSIELDHWYLSDNPGNLRRWKIPAQTLAGYAHATFDEQTGFNVDGAGFGLSRKGEKVFLSYLPQDGTKGRVVDSVTFKAQEAEFSLGRYRDGGDFFYHMAPTRDAPNQAGVPRLVIDEIMFHPLDMNGSNALLEYIELYNPTDSRIQLENDFGQWRIDGGIDFVIPQVRSLSTNQLLGMPIPPQGRLLIVGFDPTDTGSMNVFRNAYNVPTDGSVIITGPFQGRLANEGERIAIEKPFSHDERGDVDAWVIVDEVIYFNAHPWTGVASNTGLSLQRISASVSGNDPANWRGATPSPGRSESSTGVYDWMVWD